MRDPRPILPADPARPDPAAGTTAPDATDTRPPTLLMLAADDGALCVDDTCLPPGDEA